MEQLQISRESHDDTILSISYNRPNVSEMIEDAEDNIDANSDKKDLKKREAELLSQIKSIGNQDKSQAGS